MVGSFLIFSEKTLDNEALNYGGEILKQRTKTLGDAGENIASTYLQNKGYNILARNFRYGRNAEVDIIAEFDGAIIFVEVKTRRNQKFGTPAEAVNMQKQKKIIMAAMKFLQDQGLFDRLCRFDVIEIFANNDENHVGWKINHILNAFEIN